MKKAEDKLLASCTDYRHNVQQSSNAQEEPGYIYVIQGRKMEKDTLNLQEVVTQAEFFLKIEEAGGIYSGHTTDPHHCRSEHGRGY